MRLSHLVLSLLAVCVVQAEVIMPAGFERIDVSSGAFNNITIELAGELAAEVGTYHLLSLTELCNYLMANVVPEPATATLSLLALTLPSASRRRK